MPVEIQASSSANGVTVNTMAFTASGHDRFFDLNVPTYISPINRGSVVFRSREYSDLYGQFNGMA